VSRKTISVQVPRSGMKEAMKCLAGLVPGLIAGNIRRQKAAKQCAKADAPVLGKTAKELLPLYEQLFHGICTEEMLLECRDKCTAQQRWGLVEPFTKPIKIEFRVP